MTFASGSATRRNSRARRPRLLIVVTLTETGGAQTYVRELLPAIVADFDVSVAGSGDGPLVRAAESAGATFVALKNVRREMHPVRDFLGLIELWRLAVRIKPDLVHLNSSKVGILGTLSATLAGVRARVFTAHGWAFKSEAGVRGVLFRLLHRAVRPLLTCVICVSQAELEAGLAAAACVERHSVVIPNGVRVRPLWTAERSGIVTVTRLRPPKDTLTLIEALGRAPELPTLTIVGDGPDRAAIEQAIEARGLGARVVLVGDVADAGSYLDRAAVFVLSTKSEGMPMAVLEAMAAGLPVVASAVGGIPEIVVDGQTGLLVQPGDPEALTAALRRLLGDSSLASRLGAAARRAAETTNSLQQFQERHRALYERLLAADHQ
jgi:glycosyltransferase involved in cell wall biosynthesis